MNNIRDMFERALHEQLSAREQAEFETAMQDPAMAAAFEAYADAKADTGNVDVWLRDAAHASSATQGSTYPSVALRMRTQSRGKRGRLIRIAAALGAMAAAAAIVAVIFIQPGSKSGNDGAQDASLAGDGDSGDQPEADDDKSGKEDQKKDGKEEETAKQDRPLSFKELTKTWTPDGISETWQWVERENPETGEKAETWERVSEVWFKGKRRPYIIGDRLGESGWAIESIILERGDGADKIASSRIRVARVDAPEVSGEFSLSDANNADRTMGFTQLDVNGDGKLDGTELPKFMLEQMDDDKSGTVDADEFRKHHKPPMPPKPEEVFKQRDTNGDGKLDGPEIDERMRKDFDDDASGDVSLDEWRKHFRPKPVKPEDEFGKLDKDRDGFLTKEEIPTRIVRDWDANEDGKVSLDEFRRNFKPPMPPKGDGPMPPRPPEGDGPRPPRPPEGDGPRPPRPPEGDGPRPPRPPEGEAPRPPRD